MAVTCSKFTSVVYLIFITFIRPTHLCLGPAHVTCCTSTIYKVTFIQQQPVTVGFKRAVHADKRNHSPGSASWVSVRCEAFQNNIPDKRSVVHSRSGRKVRLSATHAGESMKNKPQSRWTPPGFIPNCPHRSANTEKSALWFSPATCSSHDRRRVSADPRVVD